RTRPRSRYSRRHVLSWQVAQDRFDVHADGGEAGDDGGPVVLPAAVSCAGKHLAFDCRGAAVDAEALGWRLGGERVSEASGDHGAPGAERLCLAGRSAGVWEPCEVVGSGLGTQCVACPFRLSWECLEW